jgi:DNA topoisomerase-1
MEEELDRISEGEQDWVESLRTYYERLDQDLKQGMKAEGFKKKGIPLEEVCPRCGRQLVIKDGRYGRFIACSGYPDCEYKGSFQKKEAQPLEEKCPQCGNQLVVRFGKYGSFIACSNYPQCTYTKKESRDTGMSCPLNCGGKILRKKTRKGKIFFGCSNFPKCDFASWDEPVRQPCPECDREIVLRKSPIKGDSYLYCSKKECSYKEKIEKEKIWEKGSASREEEDPL